MNHHDELLYMSGARISPDRLDHIRQTKKDNPTASYRELAMLCFESVYAVGKAMRWE